MGRLYVRLGVSFLVAFLGYLAMLLLLNGHDLIVQLSVLLVPFSLAVFAGLVSDRWLGVVFFAVGFILAYTVYFWLRPQAYLGDDSPWWIYLVLYVVIPTILGFAVGLFLARRRGARLPGGAPG